MGLGENEEEENVITILNTKNNSDFYVYSTIFHVFFCYIWLNPVCFSYFFYCINSTQSSIWFSFEMEKPLW